MMKNVNVAEVEMKKVDFSSSEVTTARCILQRFRGGSKFNYSIGKHASDIGGNSRISEPISPPKIFLIF